MANPVGIVVELSATDKLPTTALKSVFGVSTGGSNPIRTMLLYSFVVGLPVASIGTAVYAWWSLYRERRRQRDAMHAWRHRECGPDCCITGDRCEDDRRPKLLAQLLDRGNPDRWCGDDWDPRTGKLKRW